MCQMHIENVMRLISDTMVIYRITSPAVGEYVDEACFRKAIGKRARIEIPPDTNRKSSFFGMWRRILCIPKIQNDRMLLIAQAPGFSAG